MNREARNRQIRAVMAASAKIITDVGLQLEVAQALADLIEEE